MYATVSEIFVGNFKSYSPVKPHLSNFCTPSLFLPQLRVHHDVKECG